MKFWRLAKDRCRSKLKSEFCNYIMNIFGYRSHGCSWPMRNVTLSRSVKFRIRTWYVYKHIHLYACIFEANFSFMHSLVYSEDIKITNDAVKTCDYQVPNCFWPTYSVVDPEKNSTWTGVFNFCIYWFPYMIHKVLLSCINWTEEMPLCKMICRMFPTILF